MKYHIYQQGTHGKEWVRDEHDAIQTWDTYESAHKAACATFPHPWHNAAPHEHALKIGDIVVAAYVNEERAHEYNLILNRKPDDNDEYPSVIVYPLIERAERYTTIPNEQLHHHLFDLMEKLGFEYTDENNQFIYTHNDTPSMTAIQNAMTQHPYLHVHIQES